MSLGRRMLLFVTPLACLCLVVLADESRSGDSGDATEATALVTTATLRRGPMSTTVSGYGTVTVAPGKARTLSLAQGGLVSEVHVAAGERVKRGTILMIVDSDPAARLVFEQARTSLALARTELERTRQLRAQNLATDSQVAAAEKALSDARTALDAQRDIGGASVHNDLKAPFDGVVLEVPVAPGDRVTAGATLVRTVAEGSMQVVAGLSPQDARRVKSGMSGAIESVASERASIDARVAYVQAMVDPTSHLVKVVLEATSDATALLTDEGARVLIFVDSGEFWIAPRAAVLRDQAGAYLFQIVEGHAKRVTVSTPGPESEREIAVDGPIDPSAKVVVLGVYEVEDGMAVRESRHESNDEPGA